MRKLKLIYTFIIVFFSLNLYQYWMLQPASHHHSISIQTDNGIHHSTEKKFIECRKRFQEELGKYYAPIADHRNESEQSPYMMNNEPKIVSALVSNDDPTTILVFLSLAKYYPDRDFDSQFMPMEDAKFYQSDNIHWRMIGFFQRNTPIIAKHCFLANSIFNESDAVDEEVRDSFTNAEEYAFTLVVRCTFDDEFIVNQLHRVQLTAHSLLQFKILHSTPAVLFCDHRHSMPIKEPLKLAACVQITDDHYASLSVRDSDRLPEWIEYQTLIGFEYFVIYVAISEFRFDEIYARLKPAYGDQIILIPNYVSNANGVLLQRSAQTECVHLMTSKTRWLSFLDVDELPVIMEDSFEKTYWPDFLDTFLIEVGPENSTQYVAAVRLYSYLLGPVFGNAACQCEMFPNISYALQWQWRTDYALLWRHKLIVRPENVLHLYVHSVTNGGPTLEMNPAIAAFFHYRNPFLPGNDDFEVFDNRIAKNHGEIILHNLFHKGFITHYNETNLIFHC